MGLFKKESQGATAVAAPPTAPASSAGVSLVKKGQRVSLEKTPSGVYTLITTWGKKDYDLYALVEYVDGRVEVVSCFGTLSSPLDFSTRTSDDAVIHVSGDKTAYGDDLPQEVMTVRLNPDIKCVVPVVYSAKNSGVGSFRKYKVSTYVIEGQHDVVPQDNTKMISVEAVDASKDNNVYTFVPAVIHNGPNGPELEGVELYSRRNSEYRPTVSNGSVTMDSGEENGNK